MPGEFTRLIGSLSSELRCGREYAIKVKEKHGLKYEQFHLIQRAIDCGYAKLTGTDLEFLFYDNTTGGPPYLLVVKSVGQNEIWMRTFYRTKRWKEEMYFRRGFLLKEHVERE